MKTEELEKGCGERFENECAKRFPCNQFSLCPICKAKLQQAKDDQKIIESLQKQISDCNDGLLKYEKQKEMFLRIIDEFKFYIKGNDNLTFLPEQRSWIRKELCRIKKELKKQISEIK